MHLIHQSKELIRKMTQLQSDWITNVLLESNRIVCPCGLLWFKEISMLVHWMLGSVCQTWARFCVAAKYFELSVVDLLSSILLTAFRLIHLKLSKYLSPLFHTTSILRLPPSYSWPNPGHDALVCYGSPFRDRLIAVCRPLLARESRVTRSHT